MDYISILVSLVIAIVVAGLYSYVGQVSEKGISAREIAIEKTIRHGMFVVGVFFILIQIIIDWG